MSLKITLFATASGMARAMAASAAMLSIDVKYIGVGKGLREANLDDGGRSINDQLKTLVAWVPVSTSKAISDNQKQFTVDLAGLSADEWNFSECCLADADKKVIAIYNSNQGLMTVSPAVDINLLSINFVLGAFPAGSIEIIHQGANIELFNKPAIEAMFSSVSSLALSSMQDHKRGMLESSEMAEINRRLHVQENIVPVPVPVPVHVQDSALELIVNGLIEKVSDTQSAALEAITSLSVTVMSQQQELIQ